MLNSLMAIAADPDHSDCVKANELLLAYGFGRPVQPKEIDLTSSDGSMSGGAPHAIAIRVVHSTREEADAAKAEQGESIFGDGTGNNDSSQG